CVGPRRHVVYQNVGWIGLQPLGLCIGAEVNFNDEATLLGYGMLGTRVGERIERLDAVYATPSVRLRIVHYLGQDVDAADDVLLGAFAFCRPRSNSMNFGFQDRPD